MHFQSALFFALASAWLIARLLGLGLGTGLVLEVGVALVMLSVYLGLALHRVHPRAWWKTGLRVLPLVFIYAQLLNWALSMAVAAAFWGM